MRLEEIEVKKILERVFTRGAQYGIYFEESARQRLLEEAVNEAMNSFSKTDPQLLILTDRGRVEYDAAYKKSLSSGTEKHS